MCGELGRLPSQVGPLEWLAFAPGSGEPLKVSELENDSPCASDTTEDEQEKASDLRREDL